jgi:hypothetical protein
LIHVASCAGNGTTCLRRDASGSMHNTSPWHGMLIYVHTFVVKPFGEQSHVKFNSCEVLMENVVGKVSTR